MMWRRAAKRHALVFLALAVLLGHAVSTADAESLVGGIYVETEPEGAVIYVAGEVRGVSPCGVSALGVGEVQVRAVKEGYSEATEKVGVEPDKIRSVSLVLERLSGVGNLVVQVAPSGAEVRVDRVPYGTTPIRIVNVRAGTHRVVVSRAGYRPAHFTISVVTGRDQLLTGQLQGLGPDERDAWQADPREAKGPGELGPVPSIDEMPEEKAFDPLRQLIKERRYDEALKWLENTARSEEGKKHAFRISRDRRFVNQLKQVFEAACKGLKKREGEEYDLPLRNGITVRGKLLKIDDGEALVDVSGAGEGKSFSLRARHTHAHCTAAGR